MICVFSKIFKMFLWKKKKKELLYYGSAQENLLEIIDSY